MAQKGYLKVAKNKTNKKGNPFVSVLILDKVDDKDGHWYNIFDAQWFGGTEKSPSPYDIRKYTSQTEPTLVVYEFTTTGKFRTVTAIRPEAETWVAGTVPGQLPLNEEAVGVTTGREKIAAAIELLVDGIALVARERQK